jgi:hypothetical protein
MRYLDLQKRLIKCWYLLNSGCHGNNTSIIGTGTVNNIPTKPADGASTPSYIVDVGTLSGGQTGTFTFSVRIDN